VPLPPSPRASPAGTSASSIHVPHKIIEKIIK
jgi:hypothetical protein